MQAALDFGRNHRVGEAYRKVVRAVSDAVDAIGLLQAAGACDARKSELADALACREGRYLRVEWLMAIIDIAPPDFRDRIFEALGEWQGRALTVCRPLTDAERAERLEVALRSLGPIGEERLMAALGGRR